MLVIRFLRVGKKNQPSYKIVVTDKRNPPKAGRFTEQVGFYNPLNNEKVLNKERIQYWMSRGAQPSPTAFNLFIREGIAQGKKIAVHKKSKKTVPAPAAAPASAEASAGKPAAQAAPAAPATSVSPTVAVPTEPVAEAPKETAKVEEK